MQFELDSGKAPANEQKHFGVTFEEACEVFADDFAMVEVDEAHSFSERRYRIIGASIQRLLLANGKVTSFALSRRVKSSRTKRNNIMPTNKKVRKKTGTVKLEVTEKQYQAMQAKGIDEDALLKPGKHKFVRGLFKQMHPDYEPKKAKVRISMFLDADVLAHFRTRAAQPHAAPYQTQINHELRAIMERESAVSAQPASAEYFSLLDNTDFITRLAERLAQAPPVKRKKAA